MNRSEIARRLAGVTATQEPEYSDIRVRILRADAEVLSQIAGEAATTTQAIVAGLVGNWAKKARRAMKSAAGAEIADQV